MSQYGNPAVAQAFWRSVPPRLRPLLQGAAIFYIAMLCIDIGTMIVSILALSGSYSEDEDPIVIKFPTLALHVQRLIVAWVCVEVAVLLFTKVPLPTLGGVYSPYVTIWNGKERRRKKSKMILSCIKRHLTQPLFLFSFRLIHHPPGSSHHQFILY
ncbi:hypothetical protein FJTKL_12109 [Diaporthe vaccinii]|uniref:Uncharacterized protein n=1 Tax=Diaporthe vaccinii TaxID=105482 RepID=A0ABR4EF26_9PEZI